MDLNQAELLRSLCPDFRWLNRSNKSEVREIYEAELKKVKSEIYALNEAHTSVNQTITRYQDRWALELAHEYLNEAGESLERSAKRCGWLISSLKSSRRSAADGRITEADIFQAKQIPIETLIETRLRSVGGRLVGKCPFHKDDSPSFSIWPDQNSWHCFGACGEGGDVISFVMKSRGVGFLEAVKFLIGR